MLLLGELGGLGLGYCECLGGGQYGSFVYTQRLRTRGVRVCGWVFARVALESAGPHTGVHTHEISPALPVGIITLSS
jgi:hypothetical protein